MKSISLASLVQLVERRSPKSGVEGSSPSGRALKKKDQLIFGGLKQLLENKETTFTTFLWQKKSKLL